jgi:hypothetical protein
MYAAAQDANPPAQDNAAVGEADPPAGNAGAIYGTAGRQAPLTDLTISNFFSAGWDDDYVLRQRPTGTPDLPLLRVQTNELLRLYRMNFYDQRNLNNPTRKDLVDTDGFIDYAFNRRVMIEFEGAYQWADLRGGTEVSGGYPGLLTRIKLFDTEATELCYLFKVSAPNPSLAVNDTTITYGLTGFEDLSAFLPFDRVGLYYSFVVDNLAGPAAVGAQRNDVQCCLSVAKTVTGPNASFFQYLTFFEENFVQSVLDGPNPRRTFMTMTPGMRFNFPTSKSWKMGGSNVLILGVDLPVSNYQPWSETWRLSYIRTF